MIDKEKLLNYLNGEFNPHNPKVTKIKNKVKKGELDIDIDGMVECPSCKRSNISLIDDYLDADIFLCNRCNTKFETKKVVTGIIE